MKKLMNNQSGFSLVELMVVVAIIGILATVAIPSVSKYMAKAKQTEAKTSLASLYSANKAFFVEYNGYGTHFSVIGHAPEGQVKYNYGFAGAMVVGAGGYQDINYIIAALPNAVISAGSAGGCLAVGAAIPAAAAFKCNLLREGRVGGAAAGAALAIPAAAVVANGANPAFTAAAVGIVSDTGLTDTWTIDQNKVVVNTVNGI
jgi:type IV pilus assembly protein PilA